MRAWAVHPHHDEAGELARSANLHPVVASILLRRGLCEPADLPRFLNPTLQSLEEPWAFEDMRLAVDRIRKAVASKEKILIYGDYDVDGVTGSAILYPVLKKLGGDVEVHIPHRMNDGYGLNRATLEKLMKEKFRLVITVDNGITGVEHVKYLNGCGADVIIVDHHTPKDEMPPAYAIIGSVKGGKGDPNLAACGLAFKVAWALLGTLEDALEHLDLAVVGTVADLAPVMGDNRIILKEGLKLLAKTKRPGLRALMDVAKIDRGCVTQRDIAFGLGPRINASGRMGSPLTAFRLLTTDAPLEARNLAQTLEEGNRDRQRVEADAFSEAVEAVEADPEKASHKVLVLASENWHEGVLGIVAARLVERYHRPAIVISLKNGRGKGSGRSVPHISVFDLVLPHEGLCVNFGGHAQACGLTIEADKIAEFRRLVNETAGGPAGEHKAAPLYIEAEIEAGRVDAAFLKDLEKLAPFGPGNPKPLFVSKSLKMKGEAKKRGKDTLQCWMTDGGGKSTFEVVGFRAYQRWAEAGKKMSAVDIVYQPALKTYNGITSIQLELEDWKLAD